MVPGDTAPFRLSAAARQIAALVYVRSRRCRKSLGTPARGTFFASRLRTPLRGSAPPRLFLSQPPPAPLAAAPCHPLVQPGFPPAAIPGCTARTSESAGSAERCRLLPRSSALLRPGGVLLLQLRWPALAG